MLWTIYVGNNLRERFTQQNLVQCFWEHFLCSHFKNEQRNLKYSREAFNLTLLFILRCFLSFLRSQMCSMSQHTTFNTCKQLSNKDALPSPQNLDYVISKRKRKGEEIQIKVVFGSLLEKCKQRKRECLHARWIKMRSGWPSDWSSEGKQSSWSLKVNWNKLQSN